MFSFAKFSSLFYFWVIVLKLDLVFLRIVLSMVTLESLSIGLNCHDWISSVLLLGTGNVWTSLIDYMCCPYQYTVSHSQLGAYRCMQCFLYR